MRDQFVFKRYELKYLITEEQREMIKRAMAPYMKADEHGRSVICNLYYDTPDFILARRSIDKPVFKEKLRMRSYGVSAPGRKVFVELKRKSESVVYKRRVSIEEEAAREWLELGAKAEPSGKESGTVAEPGKEHSAAVAAPGREPGVVAVAPGKEHGAAAAEHGKERGQRQMERELEYFCGMYPGLAPVVYLSYEREAYYGIEDSGFRITFDDNILWRPDDLSLCSPPAGQEILPPGMALMEIKTGMAIPLWMTGLLTENHIYKTSFSKYGKAYQTLIRQQVGEERPAPCPKVAGAETPASRSKEAGAETPASYSKESGAEADSRECEQTGKKTENTTRNTHGGKKYA